MSKRSRITACLRMSIRERKRRKIPGFQRSIDISARIKRGIPGPQSPVDSSPAPPRPPFNDLCTGEMATFVTRSGNRLPWEWGSRRQILSGWDFKTWRHPEFVFGLYRSGMGPCRKSCKIGTSGSQKQSHKSPVTNPGHLR